MPAKMRSAASAWTWEVNGPLSPGYYFLGMTAEPVSRNEQYNQGAIFIVAP